MAFMDVSQRQSVRSRNAEYDDLIVNMLEEMGAGIAPRI